MKLGYYKALALRADNRATVSSFAATLLHTQMKYLKQKDPAMYAEAKDIIRECAENKKKKIPGYESATSSMQSRIRALVGNVYWERSKVYLEHFMAMRDLNRLEQN